MVALTKQQALDMLESDDLIGIGMEAHQSRLKKNDPRVVTYQIDRNINYTNFCTEYCSFCAFYRPLARKTATFCRSRKSTRKSTKCWNSAAPAFCSRVACTRTCRSAITKICCAL